MPCMQTCTSSMLPGRVTSQTGNNDYVVAQYSCGAASALWHKGNLTLLCPARQEGAAATRVIQAGSWSPASEFQPAKLMYACLLIPIFLRPTFQGELISPSKDLASAPPVLMMPLPLVTRSLFPCCLQVRPSRGWQTCHCCMQLHSCPAWPCYHSDHCCRQLPEDTGQSSQQRRA